MPQPRLPKIGEFVRHHGKLVAIETIPPPPMPPPKKDYIFENVFARCEIRLNGETIRDLQTLNDFYGLETSVKKAIDGMKKYAQSRNIGPGSDVEVVVVKVVSQIRTRPLDTENIYNRVFFDFRFLDHGCEANLPDPVETVVWSSKDLLCLDCGKKLEGARFGCIPNSWARQDLSAGKLLGYVCNECHEKGDANE